MDYVNRNDCELSFRIGTTNSVIGNNLLEVAGILKMLEYVKKKNRDTFARETEIRLLGN